MPTSIREQLLASIGTAVGGSYNLPVPEDERDLPACLVEDEDETAEDSPYGYTLISLPVIVAKMAAATSTDREVMRGEANALLASIITAMHADEKFGGLARSVTYTGGGIATEVGIVFAEASFTVQYQYERGDPYQQ